MWVDLIWSPASGNSDSKNKNGAQCINFALVQL